MEDIKKTLEDFHRSKIGKTNLKPCDGCLRQEVSFDDCYDKDNYYNCHKYLAMEKEKIKKAGIAKRYSTISFKKIQSIGVPQAIKNQYYDVISYKNSLKDNVENGNGLILKGGVGTMKTTLAVAILVEWLRENNGFFISMPSLLDNIFSLKAIHVGQWVEFEHKIQSSRLLVIDDLGAERTEGWVLTKVDSIISERYNRQLATIITTNMTAKQLKSTYAERIIDRLRQTSNIINFDVESLRGGIS